MNKLSLFPPPTFDPQPNPTIQDILVILSSRHPPKNCRFQRNLNNLIQVNIINAAEPNRAIGDRTKKTIFPKMSLINARSLLPKLDELTASLSINPVDMVAVTETWFNEDIDDSLASIHDYNLFRKDRPNRRGGGVCIYLFHANRQTDLENDNFECLWLWLRPPRLPRPLCGIAICAVYHPPGLPQDDHQLLKEYLPPLICCATDTLTVVSSFLGTLTT
jgi:hypothetical protein